MACVRLRVNDVDFASQHITGRDGTGTTASPCCRSCSSRRGNNISSQSSSCTKTTCTRAMATCTCRMPLHVRAPTPAQFGSSSLSSPRRNDPWIHARVSSVGILSRRPSCNGRCSMPYDGQVFPHAAVVTRDARVVRPVCGNMVMTCVPCRNVWAIRMSAPPWCLPLYCSEAGRG